MHFGIRPWELDQLEVGQFLALCEQTDRIEREAKSRA